MEAVKYYSTVKPVRRRITIERSWTPQEINLRFADVPPPPP